MKFNLSARYLLLLAGSFIWITLIFGAPAARAAGHPSSQYLYLFFAGICHQETERCFYFQGFPLGVCARCLGIYLGFTLGLIASAIETSFKSFILSHPRMLILFSVPLVIDVILPDSHWSRLVTGMIASFPVAFFIHLAVDQIVVRNQGDSAHEPPQA